MTQVSYCSNCKNYLGVSKCNAFMNEPGIPVEIFMGEKPHDKVEPGQSGEFVYDPITPDNNTDE